jgi:hypothetical protein
LGKDKPSNWKPQAQTVRSHEWEQHVQLREEEKPFPLDPEDIESLDQLGGLLKENL